MRIARMRPPATSRVVTLWGHPDREAKNIERVVANSPAQESPFSTSRATA